MVLRTRGYAGTPPFNHKVFWDTMREWTSTGCLVIVSEANAPKDFKILALRTRKAQLAIVSDNENKTREEFLFIHESIADCFQPL